MQGVSSHTGPDFDHHCRPCTALPGSSGQEVKVSTVHKPPGACTSGTVKCGCSLPPLGSSVALTPLHAKDERATERSLQLLSGRREKEEIDSLGVAFMVSAT